MTKNKRELRQLLLQIAERANARLIEVRRTGSGHQQFIASSSPSDYRDRQNTAAIVRRVLRQA